MLPSRIRRLRATNLTAAAAGAALMAGPFTFDVVTSFIWDPTSPTRHYVGQGVQLLLFVALVHFFVLGWQHEDIHSLREMGRGLVRGLFWMLGWAGAAATILVLATILHALRLG